MSASYTRLVQVFRERHPSGTVATELVRSEAGLYVVRAEVRVDRQWVLASGLAVHADIEKAEERAIERALTLAGFARIAGESPMSPFDLEDSPLSLPMYEAPPTPAPTNGHGNYGGNGSHGGHGNYGSNGAGASHGSNGYAPAVEVELDPPVDLADLIAQTDVQMERIGWGKKEGRSYLERTFGKSTRSQLDEQELREFLSYLKAQPNQIARRPPGSQAPF
jgi:hypothetical protein